MYVNIGIPPCGKKGVWRQSSIHIFQNSSRLRSAPVEFTVRGENPDTTYTWDTLYMTILSKMTHKHKCHIYIVRNMTIARQRLAEHVPERYAVNNRGTSVVG
jgi:hypothetical protein